MAQGGLSGAGGPLEKYRKPRGSQLHGRDLVTRGNMKRETSIEEEEEEGKKITSYLFQHCRVLLSYDCACTGNTSVSMIIVFGFLRAVTMALSAFLVVLCLSAIKRDRVVVVACIWQQQENGTATQRCKS